MTKCPICSSSMKLFKIISHTKVVECNKCRITSIPRNTNTNLKDIYSIREYLKRENIFKKRFAKQITKIKKIKQSGKVLDIGCGFGLFSSMMSNDKNYDVERIEPYILPYYSKRIPLYKQTFDQFIKANKNSYDIILLLDVLEHFKRPITVLNKVHRILNPQGIVVIITPNYLSLMASVISNWSWWMLEDHKVVFSVESLSKCLEISSFKIRMCKTFEAFIEFKKNFDGNFVGIKNTISRKFVKLLVLPPLAIIYIALRRLIWRLGFGGQIFVIGQKDA